MRQYLSVLGICLWAALCLSAQETVLDTLPIDSSIHFGQLPNGMSYYVKAHAEPPQRAGFRLVIKAGSLQEEEDQLGVAHFVEHMAFNGTERFAKNTLIDFIERSGSRFGADLNASTSFNQTLYKLFVQTDNPAVVDTALQILEDWASALSFDPTEVDRERGIIRSEWRSGLSSRQRLQQQLWPVLLAGSRYAERLPIGSPNLIDTVATARLINYYQRWYQPRRMAIIAVGDFDPVAMVAEIKARFGKLENTDTDEDTPYGLATQARRAFLVASDPEAPFTQWEIEYQLNSLSAQSVTIASIRNDLLYTFYGSMLNKRLVELREQAIQPYLFAQAGFGRLPGNYRSFSLSGFTEPNDVLAALRIIATEVQRAALHGFTEEELELEKAAYLQRVTQYVKELDKLSSNTFLSQLTGNFESGLPPTNRAYLPDLVRQVLPTIRPQDVQALSAQWQQGLIQTATISTGTAHLLTVPDSAAFYHTFDSIRQTTPIAYHATPLPEALLTSIPPQPSASPVLMQTDSILEVQSFQLSNGVRVHIKVTDFKEDEIVFRASSPGGLSLVDDEDYASAAHAIAILNDSGLGPHQASTLYKLLTDKQVQVSPYIGRFAEGFTGRSNQADLETCFQLLYLYFDAPRFDSLATETYRQKRREIMSRIDTDPRSAYGRLMIDLQYDYHPRRPNTTLAELDGIDRRQALGVYQERFANPADFDFVFVGNIKTDSLLLLAERYLGNLPSTNKRENWKPIGATLVPHIIDTTVVAGQTPKAEIQLVWRGDFPYNDPQARYDFGCMRELLQIRLREELREERGGVYGVRINASTNYQPDSSYYFRLRFNTEPGQADSLIVAAQIVITHLAQKGNITATDVTKIQESQRKRYEEYQRKNGFWMGQLSTRLTRREGWQGLYPGQYASYVDGLTPEALQQIITRYLERPPDFRMVLLPEE